MDNNLSPDDRVVDDDVIQLMYDNFSHPPLWMNKAACTTQDIGIYDLENNSEMIKEQYCSHCPVIDQCYRWGEKFEVHDIVYGGKIKDNSHDK